MGEIVGFEFEYQNHKLSKAIPILSNEFNVSDKFKNKDGFIVKCVDCEKYMAFKTKRWVCLVCGKYLNEIRAYEELEKENDEFMANYIYDEELDEPPLGCKACGGPYPNCVSSCNLYD